MLGRRGAPHDGVLGIVALVAERLVTAGQRIPSRSAKNCWALPPPWPAEPHCRRAPDPNFWPP